MTSSPGAADQLSPPSADDLGSELVTVVIPALNESATIRGVLDSVLSQTHPELQVVVVDGMSSDGTAEVVREVAEEDSRVELVPNPDRVIPIAMNLGLHAARGRWLVRIDAHSRVPEDYVQQLVAHLATNEWGGVGGRKNGRGRTEQGRAIAAVMGSRFGQGNSVYHYGTEVQSVDHIPFGAYPVDLLRSVGGWNEAQLVNEDYELDYRLRTAGHELLFDPAIVIDWDCRQSIGDLFRQYRRYGRGKVQTLVDHPESVALRHLAAPALVAMLGAAMALIPLRRTRRLGLLLCAPYLMLLVVATAVTVAEVDDRRSRRWVAPAFAALHLGWGSGFWMEVADELRRRDGKGPAHRARCEQGRSEPQLSSVASASGS